MPRSSPKMILYGRGSLGCQSVAATTSAGRGTLGQQWAAVVGIGGTLLWGNIQAGVPEWRIGAAHHRAAFMAAFLARKLDMRRGRPRPARPDPIPDANVPPNWGITPVILASSKAVWTAFRYLPRPGVDGA